MLYLIFSIMFIYILLFNSAFYYDQHATWILYTSAVISALTWIFQVYLEILQRKESKAKCSEVMWNFFTSLQFWDKNDLIHLIIVFIMHLANIIGMEKIGLSAASVLSAIGAFSMIIKFYEWLRIFE